MRNKVKLKKLLITIFIFSALLSVLFLFINIYEYRSYTKIYNKKIDTIILKIKEKYPKVSDNEIIDIIENEDLEEESFLKYYGIYLESDFLTDKTKNKYYSYLIINNIIFISTIVVLVLLFLKYDSKKDNEIKNITKYIEEINKKNYSLYIDEISEDELSILKNEIYKTTIMLKEIADNSLKDKKELKKSLEDISHQLKTPLTSILVMLDNIIDDTDMDNNTRDDFIVDIKREVTNINFLVQSILKLSKFDTNTINFIKEEKFLKDIVSESCKKMAILCDLKNIRINVDGEYSAKIKCDFMWQVEAVTNIIKNCVEHSYKNSVIDIFYQQNNIYSSITIKDYGEGIENQEIPHIFERFYKGKNSSSDSIGIGLALSKTIIESSNGTISVESSDKGTTFIIKYYK